LSIEYANICSSVRDHRQNFDILYGSEGTKESKWINKKEAWSIWRKVLLKLTAPEMMTSSEASSSEASYQKQYHQKLKFIRGWET